MTTDETESSDPMDELRERAARVVEQTCAALCGEIAYSATELSTELRVTMLQLIDLATRPS